MQFLPNKKVAQPRWLCHTNILYCKIKSALHVGIAEMGLFVLHRNRLAVNENLFDVSAQFQRIAVGDDHIRGEIGELLLGKVAGRTSPDEITLFKSLGLAVEDLAAAHHIYQQALAKGLGLAMELGGSRHDDA